MICLFFILKAGESPSGGFTMWSQQIAHRHLLHISIGQTPVFQKEVYKFKRMWYTYIYYKGGNAHGC